MNTREFGKSLQELKDGLKQEIIDLDASIQSAKDLVAGLKTFSDQGESLIEKMTDSETGLEAYQEAAKLAKENTEQAYENALRSLSEITSTLATVQANIAEMETAYEAFTEINDKIIDEDDGLDAALTSAKEIKDEIIAVKANADTLYTEIRKFRDEAADYVKEIDTLKSKADSTTSSIEDQYIESVALKEQIEEIYRIGSQGSQESYFARRRKELLIISAVWLVLFLGFLITAGVLAINFFGPVINDLKKPDANVSVTLVLLRALMLSPFVFGAIYSLIQYSNERRLYEKYAFKTITVASAEGSVATLKRALQGIKSDVKNDKIVEFAVNAFNITYQEPTEAVKEKIMFKAGNKLLDLTTEVNKSVGKIEDDIDKLTEKLK